MANEDVEIVWTEQGGPDIPAFARVTGYGSSLVRQTIDDQPSGSVTYGWTSCCPAFERRTDCFHETRGNSF
jgi:hypothetical protein